MIIGFFCYEIPIQFQTMHLSITQWLQNNLNSYFSKMSVKDAYSAFLRMNPPQLITLILFPVQNQLSISLKIIYLYHQLKKNQRKKKIKQQQMAMKRYQIDTNQVVELLQKASLSVKNQRLDNMDSVRNSKAKHHQFTKEFLKMQLQQSPKQPQKQLSNSELAMAMQKYHQLLQQKKEPRSHSKNSTILNQLVTKVAPNLELNMLKKPPTPTEVKSHRPSTSETKLMAQFQHKRQQSNGSNIYKKLQSALMPKSQSQQITPVSTSEKKFFESSKQRSQPYYLGKIRSSFCKPILDDYFSKIYREHFYQTYQGIYVAQLLKPAEPSDLKNKQVQLKKKECYKDKITLVFDLDETLVHCNETTQLPYDVLLQIQINPVEIIKAGINIRPGAVQLLESLVQDFELIVFTASHSCYAQKVIDYLDPTGKLISHRLFRDNCIMTTGGMYTKDLRIFDRPLSQLVLIDNAAYSYAWQVDNGIPIIPFYDHKDDRELEALRQYLMGMVGVPDVRQYNRYFINSKQNFRDNLKLYYFNDNQGPASVYEKLFNQKMEG
ncbi:hypothetical protein pb186bvf_000815 [Paramecium bursaria]